MHTTGLHWGYIIAALILLPIASLASGWADERQSRRLVNWGRVGKRAVVSAALVGGVAALGMFGLVGVGIGFGVAGVATLWFRRRAAML